MNSRPTILCPVDFSDASRGALRYASAIAEHFGSRLVILAVEDPLLTEAVDLGTGVVCDASCPGSSARRCTVIRSKGSTFTTR
jgi:hypothetical protein